MNLTKRLATATILVACAVFGPLSSLAALTPTSPDAATAVVRNWFQLSAELQGQTALDIPATPALQEIHHEGRLLGYVGEQNGGYVVVPAYVELPPITAYSPSSTFNVADEGGFVLMLKEALVYKMAVAEEVLSASAPLPEMQPALAQIEQDRRQWQSYAASYEEFTRTLAAENAAATLDVAPEAEAGPYGTLSVEPLCQTTWHQSSPYFNFCPMGDGGRTLVGCVATAAAQILAYWRAPANGTGSSSYTWNGDNSCGGSTPSQNLTATYSDSYDWANVLNSYSSTATQAQRDAVAEINYEMAVAFQADFGRCATGAYTGAAVSVFQNYFGMASDIERRNRNAYTASAWFALLQEDLNIGWPMQYRIAAHSIVCDGWRISGGNQVHMNYGWADSHTAWYTVDALYCNWAGCDPMVEYVIRRIHPANGGTPSPSVTVTTPNGGESWNTGATVNVTWTSSNYSDAVHVQLNRTYPTGTWETLASSTANDGSHSWTVSGAASGAARVRVVGATNSAVTDESNANFSIAGTPPPPSASLTMSTPNGGEVLTVGLTNRIYWTSSNVTGSLRIDINRNYPSGNWESIVSITNNDGGHTWVVSGPATANARIRVMSIDMPTVGDTSNASFTINGGTTRSLTVTAPNGGDSLRLGSAATITWTSSGLSGYVRIELNRNYPSGTWETLAYYTSNDGSHPWSVSGAASSSARIRIRSTSYSSVGDTSNANFVIAASGGGGGGNAALTVVYPNGGETLDRGSYVNIRWTSTNLTGLVRIQVNYNYPSSSWQSITSGTYNDGYHMWRVPTTVAASNRVRVRIISYSYASVGDTSNADLSIGDFGPDGNGDPLAVTTELSGAYPNPFNPATTIRYTLAEAAQVRLEVFDVTGRQVALLTDAEQPAGEHSVRFDGANLSAGTYFLRMNAGAYHNVQKLLLMK